MCVSHTHNSVFLNNKALDIRRDSQIFSSCVCVCVVGESK
jgi:hypothetical protein